MIHTKLINQIRTLDKKELNGFNRFIRSPYFNKNEEVIKLFEIIQKQAPNYNSIALEKKKVFKKTYPKEAYKDVKLRNLMSKLSRLVEEYLIQLYYKKNNFKKEKLLAEIYGERNAYVIFESTIQKLLKELQHQPYSKISDFKEEHALNLLLYEHIQTIDKDQLPLLKNALKALEQYFITERLRIGLALSNREILFSESHSFSLQNYEHLSAKTNLIYSIYRKALQLQTDTTAYNYLELKETFLASRAILHKKTGIVIFRLLLNYSILRTSDQELAYTQELLNWYQIGLDDQLIFENGLLQYADFQNIVIIAAKLQKFEWAKSFIETHTIYLPTTLQQKAVAITSSFLYFFQGLYEQVLHQLLDFQFHLNSDYILAKTLLLRAYYKLLKTNPSYYEPLTSLCKSFENYIRRSTVMHEIKKSAYLNFISFLRQLVQFDFKDSLTKSILNDKLNAYTNIFAKSWLQEEIDLL